VLTPQGVQKEVSGGEEGSHVRGSLSKLLVNNNEWEKLFIMIFKQCGTILILHVIIN